MHNEEMNDVKYQGINGISSKVNFNMNYYMSLLLSRKEKENLVIKLTQEGKTREIAKQVHVSLRDIGKIQHKLTGNEDPF